MLRADDKIQSGQAGKQLIGISGVARGFAQLNAAPNDESPPCGALRARKDRFAVGKVVYPTLRAARFEQVHMIRQADLLHSRGDPGTDHILRRRFRVKGKRTVRVIIRQIHSISLTA